LERPGLGLEPSGLGLGLGLESCGLDLGLGLERFGLNNNLPLSSTWPHLNSDVGLEEGEY